MYVANYIPILGLWAPVINTMGSCVGSYAGMLVLDGPNNIIIIVIILLIHVVDLYSSYTNYCCYCS